MDSIHKFGKNNNLLGIYSEADIEDYRTAETAVIIINSGLVHRSGPFRVNTELSQALVKIGCNVLRFDLSGVGDSEVVANDGRPYKERFCDDIGEAIDFLQAGYDIKNFILLGLCTGADLAHTATVRYPAVVGCIVLDGYGYPNLGFRIRRYGPILLDFKRLQRAIVSLVKPVFTPASYEISEKGMDAYFWELPHKKDYVEQMSRLHDRNVKQLYVFSGGIKDYYNYKNQFSDSFNGYDFARDVTVEYLENADHTYILLACRARLFSIIKDWLRKILSDSKQPLDHGQ